jgi:predicted nucleic acid-binding protein
VIVVSNSSPLIAFEQLGMAELLAKLFGKVFIPSAVRQETFKALSLPAWVGERPLSQPLSALILRWRLGDGEREAIALAIELQADLLLMDELPGRRAATGLGLKATGTFGVLLRAKGAHLIPAVKPLIEQLVALGFHADEDLILRVLQSAGES